VRFYTERRCPAKWRDDTNAGFKGIVGCIYFRALGMQLIYIIMEETSNVHQERSATKRYYRCQE
jgi:hypothetical protein